MQQEHRAPAPPLVLLGSSAMLARLLDGRRSRLLAPLRLGPGRPLPAALGSYGLRFALA